MEALRTGQGKTSAAHILVADDNADMLAYLRRLLGERCEAKTVMNGEEALFAAVQNPPDLILADVMMPKLNGFGLLRERLKLMGGSLNLESSPGKGSSFSMIVPLESREKPDEGIRVIMPEVQKDKPSGDKIRILLVDDHTESARDFPPC
jgi:CheY-like chemotaxis protein